jgi:Protein of unknown function (DUF3093)
MHSYRERLSAPLLWWVIGAVTLFTFGAIVWTGFDLGITLAVFAALFAIEAAFLLNWGRATIEVADGQLKAGNAKVRLADTGAVHALDERQFRAMRGPHADPRAYLLIRPYLRYAVYVELTSPDSAYPYWLVATRRPDDLAAAIELSRPVPRAGDRAVG